LLGFWITFLNLECLSAKLRQTLSSILSAINERKEFILVNNEALKVSSSSAKPFGCFAITQPINKCLTDSLIDSLKSTKIEHYVGLIGKDLLDKFRLIHCDCFNLESYLQSNLIVNGFDESLSQELIKLVFTYENLLKFTIKRNGLKKINNNKNKIQYIFILFFSFIFHFKLDHTNGTSVTANIYSKCIKLASALLYTQEYNQNSMRHELALGAAFFLANTTIQFIYLLLFKAISVIFKLF
jgi:hypothetical protein